MINGISSSSRRKIAGSLFSLVLFFFANPLVGGADNIPKSSPVISFALNPLPAYAPAACEASAFILLNAQTVDEMRSGIRAIEAAGGCISDAFPPAALFGFAPQSSLAGLVSEGVVARLFEGAVDEASLAGFDAGTRLAASIWNRNFANPAPPPLAQGVTPKPLVNDFLQSEVPVDTLGLTAASPNYYQTSEYMAGSIAVGIILPESSGLIDSSTEDWDQARIDQVVAEIQAAMAWWQAINTLGSLSFYYDIHTQVPTGYEPINNPSQNGAWLNEVYANMGYSGPSWYEMSHNYLNAIRALYHTDWTTVFVVVDSLNDPDGAFTNGYFGFTYGYQIIMTYDNDGWGIERMHTVAAHEFGHNFGAADEYCAPGYACCVGGGAHGYLGIPNLGCEAGCDHNSNGVCDGDDASPNSGCRGCPTCVETQCLMRSGDVGSGLDDASRWQVGMRDSDGDGLLDPLDTTPSVTLTAYTPDPAPGGLVTWKGTASDVPWPTPTRVPLSINHITSIQYQVDGGTWADCTPDDGALDTTEERFSCTPPELLNGVHTIRVQAANRMGHISPVVSDTVTVAIIPGNFNKHLPQKGREGVALLPRLSWGSSPYALSYEYCYDSSNDNACSRWQSAGANVSVTLVEPLNQATVYYWQVRAVNANGMRYANGSPAAYWGFTTLGQWGQYQLYLP